MMLNTRVTSGCKSSSCSRSNRPEHQHLLLAPLVDLARGDLAAVRLGQHQEQVGVERLLDAALHLGDVGGERAEVEAYVDRWPEALAVRVGDVGDSARQQARRLVLERGRADHRRPDLLVDRLELAVLLDLQLQGVAQRHPTRAAAPAVGADHVPARRHAGEFGIARDAQQQVFSLRAALEPHRAPGQAVGEVAVPRIVSAADLGPGGVGIGLDGVDQLVLEIELTRIVGGAQAGADAVATERVDDLAHRPPHRAVERVDRQAVRAGEPVLADRQRIATDDVLLVLVDP